MKVGHGLYRPDDVEDELTAELEAWQLLLPERSSFTHLTTAQVYGWWLPPLPDDLPVFVSMAKGTVPKRPELAVIRAKEQPKFKVRRGLRLALPADALLACSRDLGLIDLVVMIDSAIRADDVTLDELEIVARGRAWGAPRLRAALEVVDPRSESAWETLLRLLHVKCGVAVKPQHELFDENGSLVARGDLWLVGTTRFHEYDGGDHLKRKQQRKDLKRAGRIDRNDWDRRGYTSEDVLKQGVRILRDADEALGREHEPSRIRAWHTLLRESLFTLAGRERLRARLGLTDAA